MNEIGARITTPQINTNTSLPAAKTPNETVVQQPVDQVSVGKNEQSVYDKAAHLPGKALKLAAGVAFGALNVVPHAIGGASVGSEVSAGFDYCGGMRYPETGYLYASNFAHAAQGAALGTIIGGIPGAIIGGLAGFGYGILTTNQGFGPAAEAADNTVGKIREDMDDKAYKSKLSGKLEGTVRGAFHGAAEGFTMFIGKKD